MIKVLIRFLITAVILAVAFFMTNSFWPEWWKNPFVPPMPVFNDCSVVEAEINKYDWNRDIAIAVAKAESGCASDARGDENLVFQENGRDYGYSVGVFQVRILPGREECDTYNVATNVKCAYAVYREAGWGAWSMYENGSYIKYTWRGLDHLW